MNLDAPLGWDLRFFLAECGLAFIATGYLWRRGLPAYRSRFGLLVKSALASPESWRALHAGVGRVFMAVGILLLIPFSTYELVIKAQLPLVAGIIGLGIVVVKYRVEKRQSVPRQDEGATGEEHKRLV